MRTNLFLEPVERDRGDMTRRHFVGIADFTPKEYQTLLSRAEAMKADTERPSFPGKVLALLFEKPSLRTRVSFDVGMYQLGGHCLYLSPAEVGLGQRESVQDTALVLSRYVDVIAARTFAHRSVQELAEYGSVPVINALSDQEHPCQALADMLTMQEHKGELKGRTIAYIGDANNCANSLLLLAAILGVHFRIASPQGYQLQPAVLEQAQQSSAASGAEVFMTEDPDEAVQGADALYTDVWTSMGQESERVERERIFRPYQINKALLRRANPNAIILHPLPAHTGDEVAEGILYEPQSVVFDQAENRLHAQKAVLATLLECA